MYDAPGELDDMDYETAINDSCCDCEHHTHYDPNEKWSLQKAIAVEFKKFIDKSLTVNSWHCVLDLQLNT